MQLGSRVGRKAAVFAAVSALSAGCTWVGWGSYPQASGDGVERYGDYLDHHSLEPYKKKVHPYPFHEPIADADLTTVVTTPELTLLVELEGYSESVYLWGIVVPVIPSPGHLHGSGPLRVIVHVAKAEEGARLQAQTLRLRAESGEYAPRAIHLYGAKGAPQPDPSEAVAVHAHDRLDYDFDLPAPHEPFTISVEGVPPLEFRPKTVWKGGLLNMK
jgi:hypothetical protein